MSRVQATFLCLSNVAVDLSHLYRRNFPGNLKTESGIAVSLQRMQSQNVCAYVCTCTSAVQLAVSPATEQWTSHSQTSIRDRLTKVRKIELIGMWNGQRET